VTDDVIDAAPPRRLLVLLLVLLPAVLQAAIVTAFGSRMLLWDELYYARVFRAIGEGQPWVSRIWHQHNEHRIVWTKLVFFANAGFLGWNPIVDMYVSVLLTALIAWGIWKLYRAAGPGHPAYFIPVALLLCSLAQYMNILYGLMTCHYFTLAGMIWAIVFLMRRTWTALAAAVACACAAMVSTLNAIIIAPIGLLVLVMTRQKPARWIVWSAAMLGCGYAYFRSYQRPGQAPPYDWWSATTVLQSADTFLLNLGSPLSAGDIVWGRALGVMTVGALVLLWLCVWIFDKRESHAGMVALSLVAVGCAAAVAIGRAAGASVALESKYVAYSTLALVAPYLGLACLPDLRARGGILGGLTAVIGVGLLAANLAGFEQTREWQRRQQRADFVLQTIEMQPDEAIAVLFGAPQVPQVRDAAAYLRATRLGPFRDAADVLMAPRWRDGLPTGAITAGSPLRTHVVCPVDTLVDVGLVVGPPPGGAVAGSVQVSVNAGGQVVGRGRIDARDVKTIRYIRVDLDSPVRGCRGTDLIVEATADAANPAGALLSWTYPIYYAGVTRQGGRLIDQRSLGVAFNAFSYGLIE
jgi:hypothetical protein